jgi:Tfp pilus assembly pilus retraction ATPase PilT
MKADTHSFPNVREALSRIMLFLARSSEQVAVTDITLLSDGSAAIRANTFLQCSKQPWLADDWELALVALLGIPPWKETPRRLASLIKVVEIEGRRFRCVWSRHRRGEELAVRPLPNAIPSPDELRLPQVLTDTVAALSGGLVLICGPTGAGKSWSMASLMRHRAEHRGGKYITLESPIEFLHANTDRAIFHQREIGEDVATYALGLEEALIQNPDFIGIQELRDKASAETALAAALSGHLVIATLHASDAASAAERYATLMDVVLEQKSSAMQTLSLALELIVAMRLLPGHSGLVPIFDLISLRESPTATKRIPKLMTMIATGQVNGLRNEQIANHQSGMLSFEQCILERIAEGVLLV